MDIVGTGSLGLSPSRSTRGSETADPWSETLQLGLSVMWFLKKWKNSYTTAIISQSLTTYNQQRRRYVYQTG